MSCALLPASCSLCHASLLHLSAAPVCPSCWDRLHAQTADLCTRCGEDLGIAEFSPGFQDVRETLCRPCTLAPPAFDRAIAFGVYEGTLRSLIHLLKYDRVEPVARQLAAHLAPQVSALLAHSSEQVMVVPVPLHPTKQKERSFNQAELLARAVVATMRGHHLSLATGLLQRKRATESQAMLSNAQRRRNLRGAFFVPANRAEKFVGSSVLLIDDIYTTGATARACSQALRQAGAARIWVATIARAQKQGAIRWDAAAFTTTSFQALQAS